MEVISTEDVQFNLTEQWNEGNQNNSYREQEWET
jgi:hypothetical protein